MRGTNGSIWLRRSLVPTAVLTVGGLVAAFTFGTPDSQAEDADVGLNLPADQEVSQEMILRGRQLVINHGCGDCHGGIDNPSAEGWLAGATSPAQEFPIGACATEPGAEPCFMTRPRNLTPDNTTGLGRFSDRQIFNALRFGLRPGETADVEITSTTPGEGNFPMSPKFLAPPMPWPAWRHMSDEDLWAIAAYLKHGVKPVTNQVADSEGPPDFWESAYTEDVFGPHPASPFPTTREVMPEAGSVDMDKVLHGRQMVVEHGCGDCHGGLTNPGAEGWLAGANSPGQVFPVGPCLMDPAEPCYWMRPRNLTPDEATGLGSRTERQIFNALRYGLRPSGTPDMEITADNFPDYPDYLGPGMPWPALRHMSDQDIWAIAAYLKHAVRPVNNVMQDSDRPEEGWADAYGPGSIGTHPPPGFPTANEVGG